MNKPNILIIDDNTDFVDDLKLLLAGDYNTRGVYSGREGLKLIERHNFDLLLLDIDLGDGPDGLDLLDMLKQKEILLPVIMITRDQSIDTVVMAIKKGAYHYVGKKPDLSELKLLINRAIEESEIRRENLVLREEFDKLSGELLGNSPAIQEIKNNINILAAVNATVLITGETGTGKELVARQIHAHSLRHNKPFVAINCAAIPRDLFESELFGHEKGAFTGAEKRQIGKFEKAHHGTIFLDELAELNSESQAKLLRVIENRTFSRVGGVDEIFVDVRIIAASNRNLQEQVENGNFRKDLYYRFNVSPLHIPPLRERREDISLLITEFISRKNNELGGQVKGVSEDALVRLVAYNWPGNVREIINLIEHAMIYTNSDLLTDSMFPAIQTNFNSFPDYESARGAMLDKFKRDYITAILAATNGNVSQASQKMGLSRQGLIKMMKALDISAQNFSHD